MSDIDATSVKLQGNGTVFFSWLNLTFTLDADMFLTICEWKQLFPGIGFKCCTQFSMALHFIPSVTKHFAIFVVVHHPLSSTLQPTRYQFLTKMQAWFILMYHVCWYHLTINYGDSPVRIPVRSRGFHVPSCFRVDQFS